jgi:H+/gluconate symporter-like permease
MGDDAFQKYWRFRLFEDSIGLGIGLLIAIIGLYIGGPIVLGWYIWDQVRLEKSFYDRYGQSWQEEYQKYYGSLSQAHLKIAICVMALVSIMAIGLWFYRQARAGKGRRLRG